MSCSSWARPTEGSASTSSRPALRGVILRSSRPGRCGRTVRSLPTSLSAPWVWLTLPFLKLSRGECPALGPPNGLAGRNPPSAHLPGQVLLPTVTPGCLMEHQIPVARSQRMGSTLHRPPGRYPAGCFDPQVGCSHASTAGSDRYNSTRVRYRRHLLCLRQELANPTVSLRTCTIASEGSITSS